MKQYPNYPKIYPFQISRYMVYVYIHQVCGLMVVSHCITDTEIYT